ncbi:hypothetical protein [Chelativorans sp. Marseille-P2723]|uniref:hypothetical protein n=1 Tax=Chelativorans sp. Marseille-P2723 TaxID=2709133 RepID=UPI001570938E|nr:hypothetical protein [Chelativorans sp. Marseille-P2723]
MADDLFMRLTTVHRPDCALFTEGPLPQPVPDPDRLAETLGTDEAAAYAAQCHPIFEDLRRIVGQLAGLMILGQLTEKSEVVDLDELDLCRQRWEACAERLHRLAAPGALAAHLEQLMASHSACGRALGAFSRLPALGQGETVFDEISRQIQRAYAHLRAATSQKAGLEMVDLTHACCSCGR